MILCEDKDPKKYRTNQLRLKNMLSHKTNNAKEKSKRLNSTLCENYAELIGWQAYRGDQRHRKNSPT